MRASSAAKPGLILVDIARKKSTARNPLWRLVPLIHKTPWRFWGGMSLINLGRLLEAFMPLCLKAGIDRMAAGDARLGGPALAILGLMVARYIAFNFGRRYVREVGVEVAFELRQRLYWHLELMGPRFFAGYTTGDLMARAINDISLIRQMIGLGTRLLFVLGFSGIIAFVFMLHQSPSLTLLLLPALPFFAIFGWVLANRIFSQSTVVQEGFSNLSAQVQENLNGIRTIQTHAQEAHEIRRFEDTSSHYAHEYYKLMFYNSALNAWMLAITGFTTLLIVGFGGAQVLSGEISVGTFTAFIFYLGADKRSGAYPGACMDPGGRMDDRPPKRRILVGDAQARAIVADGDERAGAGFAPPTGLRDRALDSVADQVRAVPCRVVVIDGGDAGACRFGGRDGNLGVPPAPDDMDRPAAHPTPVSYRPAEGTIPVARPAFTSSSKRGMGRSGPLSTPRP